MTSKSEKGHAKNLANLNALIALCISYGAVYNPSLTNLGVGNLNILSTNCKTDFDAAVAAHNLLKKESNIRRTLFKALPATCVKIMAALKASKASKEDIKDAQHYVNLIRGSRRKKQGPAGESQGSATSDTMALADPNNPDPKANVPKTISNSHRSFDNMLANFNALINLLQGIPSYNPNEAALSPAGLSGQAALLLASLSSHNTLNAANLKALEQRNSSFYTGAVNLYSTAMEIKQYVKSVFGNKSSQYKAVHALQFAHFS